VDFWVRRIVLILLLLLEN